MKNIIALVALLLVSALLFGCTQQKPPSQGQPSGQPQVTAAPVEDVAANALENDVPSSNENLTNLDGMLVNLNS
jgi:hypothetical protein